MAWRILKTPIVTVFGLEGLQGFDWARPPPPSDPQMLLGDYSL